MKIKEILNQNRRDFNAIYECESCWNTEEWSWYDDSFFHENVIPSMKCGTCWEKAKNYKPRGTKYAEGQVI